MLQFGIVAEVDEQAQRQAGGVEIIDDLGAMFIRQCGNGFEFQENRVVANKIRNENLLEGLAFVLDLEPPLGGERNALKLHLDFEAFLIDGFEEPAAFFVIDLETRADDSVTFVAKEDFRHDGSFFMGCGVLPANDADDANPENDEHSRDWCDSWAQIVHGLPANDTDDANLEKYSHSRDWRDSRANAFHLSRGARDGQQGRIIASRSMQTVLG